jgi:hypothetical protein
MTPIDREHYYDYLYFQAINTSLNFNLNKKILFDFNLNTNKQRYWRPITGVGEITDEQFAGNYMIDSNKSVNYFIFLIIYSYLILYKNLSF